MVVSALVSLCIIIILIVIIIMIIIVITIIMMTIQSINEEVLWALCGDTIAHWLVTCCRPAFTQFYHGDDDDDDDDDD